MEKIPSQEPRFSVCILCYGDYVSLAERCLGSVLDSFSEGIDDRIQDIRIGLNKPSESLKQFIHDWAKKISQSCNVPVLIYEPKPAESNTYKWPLMRRMFFDPQNKLADLIMWFDDDSYLTAGKKWWDDIHNAATSYPLVGVFQYKAVGRERWSFIRSQPWANPSIPMPMLLNSRKGERYVVSFAHGAWWTFQSRYIYEYDFPFTSLKHNGGDSLFGEFCRQQQLAFGILNKHKTESSILIEACRSQQLEIGVVELGDSVIINSDGGEDNTAPRRGYREKSLGFDYQGVPYSTEHQNFNTTVTQYQADILPKPYILPPL